LGIEREREREDEREWRKRLAALVAPPSPLSLALSQFISRCFFRRKTKRKKKGLLLFL